MSKPKEKDGCTASCCAAPQPLPQVEDDCGNTDCCSTNDAAKSHCESPSSIGAGSGCQDDCCAAPKPEAKDGCCSSGSCTGEKAAETTKDDVCCKLSSPGGEEACSDECCRPANSKADFGRQDACCASTAQGSDANDSCCGPKTPIASSANSDGCCASKNENFKDGCCEAVEPKADDSCKDSCCDAEEAAGEKDSSNDLSQDSCKDACCSSKSKSNAADPPCCEGKQKPCCDATCIDRLVLRETAEEVEEGQYHNCFPGTAWSNFLKGDNTTTGSTRSREKTIRERYETRLAALGCLCRALIALGQESCCASSEVSSVERKRGPKKSLRSRSREKPITTCSKSKVAESCCSTSPMRKPPASAPQQGKSCSKGCCGGAKKKPDITPIKEASCCSGSQGSNRDCCQLDKSMVIEHVSEKGVSDDIKITNLEKGLSGSERVVLSISGMTCTGCETKLQQTLGKVDAVKNLKTSLVMARVEFQLDLGSATPEEVMKHIERTTEFKCDRIATHGSTIEVIPAEGAKQFIKQPMPLGVENVDLIDDQTVRITFEPEIIGARDLINKGFQTPLTLAPPQADPALAAGSKHVRHMGWMTLASALLTVPVLVLAWAPLEERPVAYGSVSLALATLVQVFIAGPFYPKALKSLIFSRVVEMDLLIVLSTTAAYVFSVVSFGYLASGQPLSTGDFFETSTLLVTLIMVGRWVSALARQKAVESISIRALQASTAIIISSDGTEAEVDARLLQHGDVFKVAPHTQAPTDGVILSGETEVDESMLTGESRPVEKKPGSIIIAGSLNGPGTITARLTKLPGENTISTIAGMVDDAKLTKPKIQDLADRVASYFVPVVVSLTIAVFVIWIAVGIRVQGKSGSEAVTQAITYAITVLIVSCPCAIGLAVPMVIVIACGVAAEKGLIFKASEALEVAHKTSHVVFDKTGTLTEGKLSVVMEEYPLKNVDVITPRILGLLADVNHPVSSAVTAHLKDRGIQAARIDDVKSLPGKGVEGYVNGLLIQAGNSRWLGVASNPRVRAVLSKGYTAFCVTVGPELQAVYGLCDTIRADAASVVAALQKRNIAVSMLSGDDDGAVSAVASAVGIPPENAKSRCSPADKRAYIQELLGSQTGGADGNGKKQQQQQQPVVVFVGDGTNDAVALAQATIGVHVNSGTDVAQSAADVVLVRPALAGLLVMLDVSRAAVRRVAFNFGWSAVYNVFAVLLAAGAFVSAGSGESARIPPEFAGLGELVSVLPVVVVAVSLRWARL
ncbi:heavy metal translocatin [Hypoxylon rubiginosum]|uniref:Heavy metal translocatin n=1 Tax=Hypoxylon rubiginosum TaxID=110542 RepID=A0ACC0D133_9PEZI|nr:heavy metal translocatin [Hypoxylon rubiginosum]